MQRDKETQRLVGKLQKGNRHRQAVKHSKTTGKYAAS